MTFAERLHEIVYLSEYSPFAAFSEEEKELVIAAHTQKTSITLNPKKTATLTFDGTVTIPWESNGLYLPERPLFTTDPLFHAGAYYVQDASSMFVGYVIKQLHLRENWGNTPLYYLDLCAAPGGKSTHIASLLKDEDLLLSNEIIQSRAAILTENIVRWGQANTWVSNNDPKDFGNIKSFFDFMLIDAPCTGSGLWRKDAESINEWSEQHVKLCNERQKRILSDAIPSLKDGGYMLYATCSYSPEENQQIVDWLMENFDLENITVPTEKEWGIYCSESPKHQGIGYHFYPWKVKGEGFFVSIFKKKGDWEANTTMMHKFSKKSKPLPETAIWNRFLQTEMSIHLGGDNYFAFNKLQLPVYQFLFQKLRIKKAGIRLGKIAKNDIIPEHEFAMSLVLKEDLPTVALTYSEAISFLKRENNLLTDKGLKGWHLVTYSGQNIGWGKWMPGRMNNYLPQNLKIRMTV